ncbi:protein-disulfide reductase DsbD domain-containing protein [Planctomycetota bacterium]
MNVLLYLTLLHAWAGLALAQPVEPEEVPLVQVRMISECDQITPGQPWLVGIHFTLKPQWHIYWKNPGQAGLATEIDYQVPAGVSVRPLEFPAPKSFDQGGGVIGYGYEDTVLLLAEIQVDPQAAVTGEFILKASAYWLACKDRCVLGEQQVQLTIELAEEAHATAEKNLLHTWQKQLPKALQGQHQLNVHSTQRQLNPELLEHQLEMAWSQAPGTLEVFPYLGHQDMVLDQIQTTHKDQTSRVDLRLSIPKAGVPPKASAELLLKSERLGAIIVPVTF